VCDVFTAANIKVSSLAVIFKMYIPHETVYYWLGETFPAGRIPNLDSISVASLNIRMCNIMYDIDLQIVKIMYDGDHAPAVVPALYRTACKALTTFCHVQQPLPQSCELSNPASEQTDQAKTEAQTALRTSGESIGTA